MNKETEQSLKVIERKIKKQEALVEVKRQKYTMVAQDYTNAEMNSNHLKNKGSGSRKTTNAAFTKCMQ